MSACELWALSYQRCKNSTGLSRQPAGASFRMSMTGWPSDSPPHSVPPWMRSSLWAVRRHTPCLSGYSLSVATRAGGSGDRGISMRCGELFSHRIIVRERRRAVYACVAVGQAPSCCIRENRFATPQCSVILPWRTRMTSTVSKWMLRPVGARPRNVPWCVP